MEIYAFDNLLMLKNLGETIDGDKHSYRWNEVIRNALSEFIFHETKGEVF